RPQNRKAAQLPYQRLYIKASSRERRSARWRPSARPASARTRPSEDAVSRRSSARNLRAGRSANSGVLPIRRSSALSGSDTAPTSTTAAEQRATASAAHQSFLG